MAKRWSLNEDYIVCKYCVENGGVSSSDVDVEELRAKLVRAGFSTRSNLAIKNRSKNYECLIGRHIESPNMTDQEREVIELVYGGLQIANWVDARVEESYNAECFDDDVYSVDNSSSDLSHYLPIGEVSVQPSFRDVLDELMDQYYLKHKDECKTLGALKKLFKDSLTLTYGVSIDTFNSIHREKYETVSRKNMFKLCFALELDYEDAKRLLASIGLEFRHNKKEEVVYEAIFRCSSERRFVISEIDDTLERNGCAPLFCD